MQLQLQDIQNAVLFQLQQSELVNFGGAPNWSAATNPAISQSALTFWINVAYMRVMVDLSDCEIELAYFTMTSTAQMSDYPLPPGGVITNYANPSQSIPNINLSTYPNVQRVSRVFYTPVGQPWTQEHEGGVRLVSWGQFQRHNAFGYLRPFTYNIIPDYVAVQPNRKVLSFFPGTASNGDTITLEYVPELTTGTSFPPLSALTDTPILPGEAEMMLVYWATALCWPKLREMQAADVYEKKYLIEMTRVREMLGPRSRGDTFRIDRAEDAVVLSYPMGGAIALP
jgi:hypothetical protein